MKNDSWAGWRIILETHSRHQVYEESIALVPELGVLFDGNPTWKKIYKSHTDVLQHITTHLIKNKVLKHNITKQQQKADQNFLYCVGRIEWYLCSLHVGGWPYSHIVTNLISSEGTKGKSSLTGCMQRGQYICPGTNHILIQATQ